MIRTTILLLAATLLAASPAPAADRDHLDTAEVLAIAGTSAGLLLLGNHLQTALAPDEPRWRDPFGFDRRATDLFAADPTHEHVNFMQDDRAAVINVMAMGVLVGTVDGGWPSAERTSDVLQGQLLYWSGLASLSGIQSAVKGAVGRQRPLARLHPEIAARRSDADQARDLRSFWSGHASSAFYASTFLNLRLRAAMRRELTAEQWDSWSWVSPTVLYGWAGYVAFSRVHAREHWLSDVVVGSVAGWGFATLFESLDRPGERGDTAAKAVPLISLSWTF